MDTDVVVKWLPDETTQILYLSLDNTDDSQVRSALRANKDSHDLFRKKKKKKKLLLLSCTFPVSLIWNIEQGSSLPEWAPLHGAAPY